MYGLVQIINRVFDVIMTPLARMPAVAMLVVSAITAVWALLIFKAVTPQDRLAEVRDRLMGHIYEMGLYQDHLSILARIQGRLALANLRYMSLTFPALLVLLLPMVLTLGQLSGRFEYRAVEPGESIVFSVELDKELANRLDELVLVPETGVSIQAGPARDLVAGAVAWQIVPDKPGEYRLKVLLDGKEIGSRDLVVGADLPLQASDNHRGWLTVLLYPGSEPIASDSPLEAMSLNLPARTTSYLGVTMAWWLAFLVISMLIGLVIKGPLGVSL